MVEGGGGQLPQLDVWGSVEGLLQLDVGGGDVELLQPGVGGGGGGQLLQQGPGVEQHLQLCVEGSGEISVEEGGGQLPHLGLSLAQLHLGKHLVVWNWIALEQLLV